MKSERMTILVTPDEKAKIYQRAKALDIPAGELLRRAVADYDPQTDDDSAELTALADELERVVATTEAKLDRALSKVEKMRTFLAQSRAGNVDL
jgi:hypothetical protein